MVKLIPFACALLIVVSGCGQHNQPEQWVVRDTRTAGYPSDKMYPWLLGGKSKTKLYNKNNLKYIAPVCGQCER